jgi:hypothetical protein
MAVGPAMPISKSENAAGYTVYHSYVLESVSEAGFSVWMLSSDACGGFQRGQRLLNGTIGCSLEELLRSVDKDDERGSPFASSLAYGFRFVWNSDILHAVKNARSQGFDLDRMGLWLRRDKDGRVVGHLINASVLLAALGEAEKQANRLSGQGVLAHESFLARAVPVGLTLNSVLLPESAMKMSVTELARAVNGQTAAFVEGLAANSDDAKGLAGFLRFLGDLMDKVALGNRPPEFDGLATPENWQSAYGALDEARKRLLEQVELHKVYNLEHGLAPGNYDTFCMSKVSAEQLACSIVTLMSFLKWWFTCSETKNYAVPLSCLSTSAIERLFGIVRAGKSKLKLRDILKALGLALYHGLSVRRLAAQAPNGGNAGATPNAELNVDADMTEVDKAPSEGASAGPSANSTQARRLAAGEVSVETCAKMEALVAEQTKYVRSALAEIFTDNVADDLTAKHENTWLARHMASLPAEPLKLLRFSGARTDSTRGDGEVPSIAGRRARPGEASVRTDTVALHRLVLDADAEALLRAVAVRLALLPSRGLHLDSIRKPSDPEPLKGGSGADVERFFRAVMRAWRRSRVAGGVAMQEIDDAVLVVVRAVAETCAVVVHNGTHLEQRAGLLARDGVARYHAAVSRSAWFTLVRAVMQRGQMRALQLVMHEMSPDATIDWTSEMARASAETLGHGAPVSSAAVLSSQLFRACTMVVCGTGDVATLMDAVDAGRSRIVKRLYDGWAPAADQVAIANVLCAVVRRRWQEADRRVQEARQRGPAEIAKMPQSRRTAAEHSSRVQWVLKTLVYNKAVSGKTVPLPHYVCDYGYLWHASLSVMPLCDEVLHVCKKWFGSAATLVRDAQREQAVAKAMAAAEALLLGHLGARVRATMSDSAWDRADFPRWSSPLHPSTAEGESARSIAPLLKMATGPWRLAVDKALKSVVQGLVRTVAKHVFASLQLLSTGLRPVRMMSYGAHDKRKRKHAGDEPVSESVENDVEMATGEELHQCDQIVHQHKRARMG